ncbi:hypothetical protein [Fictibacillus terranigra]|uniref:30S ribosomal protein S18 n=1 Tax=Fictibacillus terranigra TaxID=3058424 RepID=A0ABT8E6Z4_9BACL|nr:hypothetical protein [Fictibacillus sp. CENA-BCM004]MDN4073654.1 hypothetical protein [Fictibacillus sp. CENA-BCM004]
MDKSELIKLYRDKQREKSKKQKDSTLFTSKKKNKGCSTCGKVTWKPKKD